MEKGKKMRVYYSGGDKERKRCCCNCGNNIRQEVAPAVIECHCQIDGHRIGYIQAFEGWCRRWKKDHTFDGGK